MKQRVFYFLCVIFGDNVSFCRRIDLNHKRSITTDYPIESDLKNDTVSTSNNVCELPKDTGPCTFFSSMFYYDKESDRCEKFRYGGCHGNDNRFYDYQPCERKCRKKPPLRSDCNKPKDNGSCHSVFDQYFYNATTNKCEQFVYTGCGGNGNRFHDEESCERLCEIHVDMCELPADSGVGNFNMTAFFYHQETNSCEEFTYHGALGNDNRFYDKDDCIKQCKTVR